MRFSVHIPRLPRGIFISLQTRVSLGFSPRAPSDFFTLLKGFNLEFHSKPEFLFLGQKKKRKRPCDYGPCPNVYQRLPNNSLGPLVQSGKLLTAKRLGKQRSYCRWIRQQPKRFGTTKYNTTKQHNKAITLNKKPPPCGRGLLCGKALQLILVNNQPAAQFGLKPSGFGGHNQPRVGHFHQFFNRGGKHRKRDGVAA